ncbi:hypothetical protein Tco_1062492 [Tanacetum coccineum]
MANPSSSNQTHILNQNLLNANMINDPLYIASSDHPGMVLTNTPFNGSNFHGIAKMDKILLVNCGKRWLKGMDKLKKYWDELQNINGLPTCDCGKMRECTCDVLEKFLLRDSNSKLIRFLMKLNDEYESVRNQILVVDPLPTINKAYYGQNGGRKDTRGNRNDRNDGFDEFFSRDSPFDMGNENEVAMNQNGGFNQNLVVVVCQEMMKTFKGKGIVSEGNAGTSHVGASNHMTPNFSLFITVTYLKNLIIVHLPDGRSKTVTIVRSIVAVGKGSRCLYICKPTVDPTVFSDSVSEFNASRLNFVPITCLGSESFSNSMSKNVLDVHTFHARHAALNGAHYFLTFIDDNTKAAWTYLVHSKE